VVTKTVSFYKLTSPYDDMPSSNGISITTASNGWSPGRWGGRGSPSLPCLPASTTACQRPLAVCAVTFIIRDMWPAPVEVGGKLLIQPVYHIWGNYIEALEGTPKPGAWEAACWAAGSEAAACWAVSEPAAACDS
jgi:hypothetical protein